MPKLPRLTALEAQRRLFTAGFVLMRSGEVIEFSSYGERVVVPSIGEQSASENRARGLISDRRDLTPAPVPVRSV